MLDLFYVLILTGAAAEGLAGEKERDTWLGLLATPLSGWEILRAKMLGALWRARVVSLPMLALWTVGLLAGALHPLGFLAAVVGLVATSGLGMAFGTTVALWSRDRKQATRTGHPPRDVRAPGWSRGVRPAACAGEPLAGGRLDAPADLGVAALVRRRLAAALLGSVPPLETSVNFPKTAAGTILAVWLTGLIGRLAVATVLTLAACRGFDAAAGRPNAGRAPTPTATGLREARGPHAGLSVA